MMSQDDRRAQSAMKRADRDSSENHLQPSKKRRTITNCTPFCDPDGCQYEGEHHKLIIELVNLKDKPQNLEAFKALVDQLFAEDENLNQNLQDANPLFCYPLLHWAVMLGKTKAVKWLLELGSVSPKATCRQPNEINETALFSAVRYLHEGLTTRMKQNVIDVFLTILDAFLKHDPEALSHQEETNGDSVLHSCARKGEVGSPPPYNDYLKRILGKLQEYSTGKGGLDVNNILQKKNKHGDTFLHLLARSDDEVSKVLEVVNFMKEKFAKDVFSPLERVQDAQGKTYKEILKERKPDNDVYQTSSLETGLSLPDLSSDEDVPSQDSCLSSEQETEAVPPFHRTAPFVHAEEAHLQAPVDEGKKQETKFPLKVHGECSVTSPQPSSSERPRSLAHSDQHSEGIPRHIFPGLEPEEQPCSARVDRAEQNKPHTEFIRCQSEASEEATVAAPKESDEVNKEGEIRDKVRNLIDDKERGLKQTRDQLEESRRAVQKYEAQIKKLEGKRDQEKENAEKLAKDENAKSDDLKKYYNVLNTLVN